MTSLTRHQVFSAVHTVGALLPADMLLRIAEGKDVKGSQPADYGVIGARSVRDDAERHWDYLRSIWSELRAKLSAAPEAETPIDPTGLAVTQWLEPLFGELGFGKLTAIGAAGIRSDDGSKTFPISHRWNHVPLHLTAWQTALDKRPGGVGTIPAQSLVQECLNRTESNLWGVVTNGRQLRLLRDSSALATASYVEFDLEAIFDGELFSEFVLLYRLLHVSRFEVTDGAVPSTCWLEKWRTDAIQTGIRALKQIRLGVQDAIAALGTGFLKHPKNSHLRASLDADALQHALLRLIYRILFVFVAEDRRLLHPPNATAEAVGRYEQYFSTARLRRVARRRRGGAQSDIYEALRIVLDGMGRDEGRPELGLPALGGIFEEIEVDRILVGQSLSNEALLAAIRHLSQTRDANSNRSRTVDYRHLGAEELGSIYEFLLELRLIPGADRHSVEMVAVGGNARKTTGSFYTHSAIISCLLDSALDPLLDEAIERGIRREPTPDRPNHLEGAVQELLGVTVCDPACGSGHFLVAAARRIAKRIAAVREGAPEPTPEGIRSAMRAVVTHCIYGVDLNPMAVELAKVSLWMEALEPGKPLGFLDAHVKQGNALVGATPALLAKGVPTVAFSHLEGDEERVVNDLKAINRNEREGQFTLFVADTEREVPVSNEAFAIETQRIASLAADSLGEVRKQSAAFRNWQHSPDYMRAIHIADAWCSSFFWKKVTTAPRPVTQKIFRALADPDGEGAPEATRREITKLARRHSFFHWHLEFPEIFYVDETRSQDHTDGSGWKGGFSCILGNPPWDTLSPDEKEFFSTFDPDFRALKKDTRKIVLARLLDNPAIYEKWQQLRRDIYALVHFLKQSGRYRLFAQGNLGKGDFNVYRMFVETALTLAMPGGSAAQVTPSGIYNGANAQAIRAELFDHWNLRIMLGFINKGEEWFDGADSTMRFGAYSARRIGSTEEFAVGFQIRTPADLATVLENPPRLSVEVVRGQSQEVLAISDTVGGLDALVTAHLYDQWPAFATVSEEFPRRVYQTEIHMGNDRDRYTDDEPGIALYEGRMVAQYDHRAKAYVSGRGRSAVWDALSFGDPKKAVIPQWVVPNRRVPDKVKNRINRFRLGFCNVASPRNERSLVAALIPPGVICGDPVTTILFEDGSEWPYLLWLAAANSLCMDFLARKKITLHLQLGVLDSLPFPRIRPGDRLLDRLAPLVLRLTCTEPVMTPIWNRMADFGWTALVPEGQVPTEAIVNETARAEAQAEIDAVVAKYLFNLEREQLEHVLTTFPTLERKETRKYGEFRTRRLVLGAFDKA